MIFKRDPILDPDPNRYPVNSMLKFYRERGLRAIRGRELKEKITNPLLVDKLPELKGQKHQGSDPSSHNSL